MLDKILPMVMKPFFLKMLPDLFDEFDRTKTDFAHVNIHTNQLKFGNIATGKIVFETTFDGFGDKIKEIKIMGNPLDEATAKDALTSLFIERFASETIIKIDSGLLDKVEIKYKNAQIWTLMKQLQTEKKTK